VRGLEAAIGARLDARLRPDSPAPLAVGLSGGSDSLALSLIVAAWARAHGRRLMVLTVDHQLRPQSADWTRTCADHAARLGAGFRSQAWTGEKPATGLPAAARAARHALLADAAREAGAQVILLGHTADDRAEAAAMRREGGSVPDPREWTPSPAWPEGRHLFLLRPMLEVRRADLKTWLADRGETWIEDPANLDPRSARARARASGVTPVAAQPPPVLGLAREVREETGGGLILSRPALRMADAGEARAVTAIAALCAGGTRRPPRGDRLTRLTEALRGDTPVIATLAGAKITADNHEIAWRREPGELRRGAAEPLSLGGGSTVVWDGRFEVRSDRPITLTALAGQARRLPPDQARDLARLAAGARGALPLITAPAIACPVLAEVEGVTLRSLPLTRLRAACGLIEREP
jgi:tRNA(Ile)-lysidine synthase